MLLGGLHAQLAVATEAASGRAERTEDGGEFCGVKEPGLVSVILGAVLLYTARLSQRLVALICLNRLDIRWQLWKRMVCW